MDWQRRSVVVTGASSGIGRATVSSLLQRGADVTAVARRSAALDALAEETRDLPGHLTTAAVDVTEADALRRVADDVVARRGHLDVWVNNAAVNLFGPLDAIPTADVDRLIDVNLKGYVNGCRAALPHLRDQGAGTLVNVSSVLAFVPGPFQTPYTATKHAVHGLTTSLRQELRDTGVTVCEVSPGPVDTPLFQAAGNYMGRAVTPPQPMTTPHRIAASVIATVERPRATRVVGVGNRLLVGAARLAGPVVERLLGRSMPDEHFGRQPVGATSGNLHEPDPEPDHAAVSGGWTHSRRRATVAAVTRVAVPALTLAALRAATIQQQR